VKSKRAAAQAALLFAAQLITAKAVSAQACENRRPTDAGGSNGLAYGAASVGSLVSSSERVRVFYALSGPHAVSDAKAAAPAAALAAARAADAALVKFAELGYRAILTDADSPCESNGGDDKIDVYLLHFPSADGQALSDHCLAGATRRCSGFVLVENDFAGGGYASVAQGMNTVVPHELFHLVQNAYDADVERWWAEGSAQWAAKQVYPELNDLERFLPAYFSQPWRPLDVPASGVVANFLYATAIWPVFLGERHGPDAVRQVFERLATGEGNVLASTAQFLDEQGESLGQEFLWFAAYNAATGSRARPGLGYRDAANYPLVALTPFAAESGHRVDDVGSGLGAFYYSVQPSTPQELALESEPARMAAMALPLEGGRIDLGGALPLPAVAEGPQVVVVAGQSVAKTDAPFSLTASDAEPASPASKNLGSSCAFCAAPPSRSPLPLALAALALSYAGARRGSRTTVKP
jgi:hypothetical protein